MKQVLIQRGATVVEDRPAPICGDGEVLVRAAYSLISAGTETTAVLASVPAPLGMLWMRRARRVGDVVKMAATRGLKDTITAVEARLAGESVVTGYSVAGVVVEVGSRVRDLVPGQRVACAGASHAHHAELVAVPRNLVVTVPSGLDLDRAAFATLGAIALQGVRQADLRLGEIACVVGLGLVGQLTVQLLVASGCRVFGVDVSRARVERALATGLELGAVAGSDDLAVAVDHATGGHGVDAALVTAASSSSEPIRQAVRLTRRRGRVVVVGAVGMDLDRSELYQKEIEVRISCSYGPGRYDPQYESDGLDYPYGFVRWTENRNLQEFLRLAACGPLPVHALVDRVFPLEQASEAYRLLTTSQAEDRPLAILLEYPRADEVSPGGPPLDRSVRVVPRTKLDRALGVAVVGPGSFAAEVHLPNLAALAPRVALRAIVGRSPNATREMARRWGAEIAATEIDAVLDDPRVDLLLISTRHDLHAGQAARGLLAGKAVFLEKPAALDLAELARLEGAWRRSGMPFVVDFNRRFAPDVARLRELLSRRTGPLVVTYRVNAGRLPEGHWAHGPHGGGRWIGEACHMVDLLLHLVGAARTSHVLSPLAPPRGRTDLPWGDNFTWICRYEDGSVTTLVYTSLGHPGAGKERIEAHWDGKGVVIDDFRGLEAFGIREAGLTRAAPDKGHREILRRFLDHVRGEGEIPIPPVEIFDVSRYVLELDAEVRRSPNES